MEGGAVIELIGLVDFILTVDQGVLLIIQDGQVFARCAEFVLSEARAFCQPADLLFADGFE